MKAGLHYIGVGVGACIFNREGKILLMLRGEGAKNEKGTWEIPGGEVEFGETIERALKREVREELGVDIDVRTLLGVQDHILPGKKQHWVAPTYICTVIKGKPRVCEPQKCDKVAWFTLSEAEQLPLAHITRNDIELLRKNYRQYFFSSYA